jgi:hypothetical protein
VNAFPLVDNATQEKLDEIPACGEGMKLAKVYLVVCAEGTDRLGIEEPEDRMANKLHTWPS